MARRASITPVLAPRLAAFAEMVPAALAGEPLAVHQARVASRRLRDLVPMLAGLDAGARRRAQQALRGMTRALGRVREADVSDQLFEALVAVRPLPAAATVAVRRIVSTERAEALRQLRRRWPRRRVGRLDGILDELRGAADAGTYAESALLAQARLESRLRATRKAVATLGVLYAPDRLHAVRIAVKRWRYTQEVAAELGGRCPASVLTGLRAVQDQLGRAHDLHVLATLLRDVEARIVARSRSAARDLRALARHLDDECRAIHATFLRQAPLPRLFPVRPTGARRLRVRAAA